MTSLNLTPHPTLASHRDALADHIARWADGLAPGDDQVVDETMAGLLGHAFERAHASEGSIWLADPAEEHLVAVFNSGPDSVGLVGKSQPLGQGIISLVYAGEQPYCENDVADSKAHDGSIDTQIGKRTNALIGVPMYFADRLRGVVSCVQFEGGAGFSPADLETVQRAVSVVERLINERLLRAAIGG